MRKNKKTKVFAPIRKKKLIRDAIVYTVLVTLLLFDMSNIYLKTRPVIKEESTEITGKVFDIYKSRPIQHSIIYLNFIVEKDEYVLYCYNNINHNNELIESIKDEEQVTLLVKQRKSFFSDNTIEVVDVRSNSKIYYNINDINIQRKNYCITFTMIYSVFILFFTLILFLYHISDFECIFRNKRKRKKIREKRHGKAGDG